MRKKKKKRHLLVFYCPQGKNPNFSLLGKPHVNPTPDIWGPCYSPDRSSCFASFKLCVWLLVLCCGLETTTHSSSLPWCPSVGAWLRTSFARLPQHLMPPELLPYRRAVAYQCPALDSFLHLFIHLIFVEHLQCARHWKTHSPSLSGAGILVQETHNTFRVGNGVFFIFMSLVLSTCVTHTWPSTMLVNEWMDRRSRMLCPWLHEYMEEWCLFLIHLKFSFPQNPLPSSPVELWGLFTWFSLFPLLLDPIPSWRSFPQGIHRLADFSLFSRQSKPSAFLGKREVSPGLFPHLFHKHWVFLIITHDSILTTKVWQSQIALT